MRHLRILLAVLLVAAVPRFAHAISGTANQITVQNGTIAIVTPLAVGQGGTGAATFTSNGVLLGNGAGAIQVTSAGTANQVFRVPGGGPPAAFGAIDVSTSAAVTGVLASANGGTDVSTHADDNVLVGNGSVWQSKALTTCTGAGKAVTYDASTNTFGCNTITGHNPVLGFSTNGDLTQNTTIHMAPGVVDTSQSRAQQIATTNMTVGNLRCIATALPSAGQTYTITTAFGTCTGALTDSTTEICQITNSARDCNVSPGGGQAITAGQCYAYKIVSSATAATSVVSCSHEITG